jgi:hypothetical protein
MDGLGLFLGGAALGFLAGFAACTYLGYPKP